MAKRDRKSLIFRLALAHLFHYGAIAIGYVRFQKSRMGKKRQLVEKKGPVSCQKRTEKKPLRIASILDEITERGLRDECLLIQLESSNALLQLEEMRPDFLLVESAWFGKSGSWSGRLTTNSRSLRKVTDWCRQREIPTIFWNKEDPVHFWKFIAAAYNFDFVITSDENMRPKYERLLKSSHISVQSFPIQPRIFHPFESTERLNRAIFAGSHYTRYSSRARNLTELLSACRTAGLDVAVFERNKRGNEKTQMERVLGIRTRKSVSQDQFAEELRTSSVGINVNTVTNSETMFSRRLVEVLATNTICISNESPAIKTLFSGGTVTLEEISGLSTEESQKLIVRKSNLTLERMHILNTIFGTMTYASFLENLVKGISEGEGELVNEEATKSSGKQESKADNLAVAFQAFSEIAFETWPWINHIKGDFGEHQNSLSLRIVEPDMVEVTGFFGKLVTQRFDRNGG